MADGQLKDNRGEILLSAFERAVIINLKEREDRRIEIGRELQRIGLNLNHPKVSLFEAIKPNDPAGFSKASILGCFLSHLSILKQAASDQVASLLILEGDADFDLPTAEKLQELMHSAQSMKWDIFYLGYHHPDRFVYSHGNGLHDFSNTHHIGGAHAVGFSKDILPKLVGYLICLQADIASGKLGPMHIDDAYSEFRKLDESIVTLVAVPALSFQRRSRSDIQDLRWYDRCPLMRKVTNRLRKILPRRNA